MIRMSGSIKQFGGHGNAVCGNPSATVGSSDNLSGVQMQISTLCSSPELALPCATSFKCTRRRLARKFVLADETVEIDCQVSAGGCSSINSNSVLCM